uniref:Uncharacterized protein n=1 Tax=Mimiviridae sp. ChoanoV1 TaxID=2596887 RepID=A0A5B8HVG6_9VIRU|nr:hypothetical protein 3_48 [Mimiviridae sp. ChoanoV1]
MSIFHEYDKILTKKIICLDKLFISEKYKTQEIQYQHDKKNIDRLLIQTPYIYNRYPPSYYEGNIENKINHDLQLDITESKKINENSKLIIEFYNLVAKIQKNIKIRIRKKNLEKLKFICSLRKQDENKYNFRTKIHSLNGKPYIRVFNSNRESDLEQKLKPNTYIRYLIHLESIWFFGDTYGFNWYLVQAEIKLPDILKRYSFYNENVLEDEENKSNVYDKYVNMHKKRIPIQAIKNKMIMDGLDPNILDSILDSIKNKTNNIPVPPPPPLIINQLNSIKLKNVGGGDTKQVKTNPNDIRVPTQNQLLEQLKKLKKIN